MDGADELAHTAPMPALLQRLLFPPLVLFPAMIATASTLHPFGARLADAEIRFTVRGVACADEARVVSCLYRPYRERDVRKEWRFHLIGSIWRIGSNDAVTQQRDESHRVVREVKATDGTLRFSLPLLDTDAEYKGYQLDSISVGELRFDRWFGEAPALDEGFGLRCTTDRLAGTVRIDGLGAEPLRGALPLWPTLRAVELDASPVRPPTVRLWDPLAKHHWDGWRTATPEQWPGGNSVVARHVSAPAVWRGHEYHAFPPAGSAPLVHPEPPAGVMPGVGLEVFWPEGETIEFPEVRFERPAAVLGLRVARLNQRARELLARSVQHLPGVELNSLSAAEWAELDALAEGEPRAPVEFTMREASATQSVLVAKRRGLTESWVYLFGVEYDSDRRFALNVLMLHPAAWTGARPEE